MTVHSEDPAVVGGADTHADTIHVAVVSVHGRDLADREFPTTTAGYRGAISFLTSHGSIEAVGIEGTSSYGAGFARAAKAAGLKVVEVNRPDRAERRRRGKSDPIDAYQAAHAVRSGRATTPSKDEAIEGIRALHNARHSAVKARTAAINQIHQMLVTSPENIRTKYAGLQGSSLIKTLAGIRTVHSDPVLGDYVSDLVVYKNGVAVDRQMVRVNHPMTWDGISFYQSFFGTAASMKITDAAGKTLYQDSAALQWQSDDGKHSIGQIDMKAAGLSVYVIVPASGEVDPNIKAGQLQLEIHQNGTDAPIATEVVDQGKPSTIAGVTYTFERTRQYTGLSVARDPGAIWVWVGSTLLVLGLFLVFFFPHRRVWVRIRKTSGGTEILCASPMKRDVAFEPQFHQFVTDIQLAGSPVELHAKVGQNDA